VNLGFHGILGRGLRLSFKHSNDGFGRLYNAWPPAKQAAIP